MFLPPFAGQVLFFLAVVNETEFNEYAWHAHFAQDKETGLVHTLVHTFCRGGKLFLDQTGEVYAGCHVLVLHEFEDYVRLAAVGVEILVGLLVVLLQCDYRVLSLCHGQIVGGTVHTQSVGLCALCGGAFASGRGTVGVYGDEQVGICLVGNLCPASQFHESVLVAGIHHLDDWVVLFYEVSQCQCYLKVDVLFLGNAANGTNIPASVPRVDDYGICQRLDTEQEY